PDRAVTAIGAGTVVSPALLADAQAIAAASDAAREVPAGPGWPETGVLRLTAAASADPGLVARELSRRAAIASPRPTGEDVANGRARLALRIVHDTDLPAAEQAIRRASYKNTDAKIARFNRRMSLPISIALIPTPLTPNQLSVTLVAIGFYSAWLFS